MHRDQSLWPVWSVRILAGSFASPTEGPYEAGNESCRQADVHIATGDEIDNPEYTDPHGNDWKHHFPPPMKFQIMQQITAAAMLIQSRSPKQPSCHLACLDGCQAPAWTVPSRKGAPVPSHPVLVQLLGGLGDSDPALAFFTPPLPFHFWSFRKRARRMAEISGKVRLSLSLRVMALRSSSPASPRTTSLVLKPYQSMT